jgi:AAA ATPase domain
MTYPSPERLEAVVRVLLEAHALAPGHERAEAEALWAAVQRSAPHTHAPFDSAWFARLLAPDAGPRDGLGSAVRESAAEPVRSAAESGVAERRQDWGEAPDITGFVGRAEELETLTRWVRDERCRVVTVLGMGGIGKTSLAARLAQQVASGFERIYWRSLRDALPVSDWLAAAVGFLSDQQVIPPTADS